MSEVIQQEGILTYVDELGNETEMYPEVKTDNTLTISGKAADAKAVGEKITEAVENAAAKAITLTQEEYDALPEEEKAKGIYVISDGEDLTAKNMFYDGSLTGLGNNVQDAVDNMNAYINTLERFCYLGTSRELNYSDMNLFAISGIYRIANNVVSNMPADLEGNGILLVFDVGNTVFIQIYVNFDAASYIRMCWYGTWSVWRTVAT